MNDFSEKVFGEFENEIKLYYCGKRYRSIAHGYGPYIKNQYLIYYIKEGKATLFLPGKEPVIISKGFFVNFPESGARYQCEEDTPWTIKWIIVDGKAIENYLSLFGITKEKPYMTLNDEYEVESIFDEMYEIFDKNTISSKIYCISLVHKLFSILTDDIEKKENGDYIKRANELIEENFKNPEFNVAALADKLALHHNYFSVLYKKETGELPVKTITACRLKNACKMLKFTDKLIKDIAITSGFSDELYFSRVFKKNIGESPTEYRKKSTIDI